ncbi:MAG: hypothetical protein KC931_25120 [Candidatus Omnitrophica bacterium]|nr:hypothetical protein [Candidatus Omnitrophota bacterium]
MAAGTYYYLAIVQTGPENLMKRAAELHENRDYIQAILLYDELRGQEEFSAPDKQARLAFLTGGAYEQLWRSEQGGDEAFEQAIRAYDQTVEMDQSEMRIYAVDALLAKAELLINRSQKSEQPDPQLEEQSWACLARLIQEPEFRLNPAVHRGVPHRMLAERTEEEDPQTAIQLLREARDAQRELEEGVENLQIAQIYLNILNQPEQAEEYFELVKQNELANEEIRKSAERALEELRGDEIGAPPLYGDEILEILPELEDDL